MKLLALTATCLAATTLQAELFFTRSRIEEKLETYTQAEVKLIQKDLDVVRSICLSDTHNTETRLYWSDALFSPERLAAVWQDGKLEIHDEEAMNRFIDKYEADRASLGEEGQIIFSFESYLEKTHGSNTNS